ncbi:MAG: hypothetical protein PF450_02020 [Bacteroidales bacterium]|nr:hypothetical protein [Bacteroidales bacterium]
MNAIDVRIGDWVLMPDLSAPIHIPVHPKQIKGITKFGELDFTLPSSPTDHIIPCTKCAGIPITADLLRKANLNADTIFQEFEEESGVQLKDHDGNGVTVVFGKKLIHLKYLHELQYWYYKVTDKELAVIIIDQ